MGRAIRIWRALAWIWGGLFVLPAAALVWREVNDFLAHGGAASLALIGFSCLYLLASLLSIVTAAGMNRGARWSPAVSWIAAAVQVLAMPVFTPLGLFGLVLLSGGAASTGIGPASGPPSRGSFIQRTIWTVIAIFALVVPLDGFFRWARHLGYPNPPSLAGALPILWACIFLLLAIHEGGHALAVKLVGGHIQHLRIGPLLWRHVAGRSWMEFRWKLSSVASGSVGWTSGSANRSWRQRLLVTAAGPAASLVCAVMALAAFPWLGELGLAQKWIGVMFLGLIALASLLNLWPSRTGHQDSDGATIHSLLTSPDFRRLIEIYLFQGMSESSELRPKDWLRVDLQWMLALDDVVPFQSYRSSILHAACTHYLDSGEVDEAVRWARRFHDLARERPKRCSPDGFAEAVFALAFYGGDLEGARDLNARRPAGKLAKYELAECLAVAAMAGEDRAMAIRRAWECSDFFGSCGTIEYLREQLRRLEAGTPAVDVAKDSAA